jgi:hypothetical protein
MFNISLPPLSSFLKTIAQALMWLNFQGSLFAQGGSLLDYHYHKRYKR